MYPDSVVKGLDRFLPCIIFAIAWSDVSLAALAYRLNIKATVTARAVVETWTISIAAWVMSYVSFHDGLVMSYVASMAAAMIASVITFVRSYGLPYGWSPRISELSELARRTVPRERADAITRAERTGDRFIRGFMLEPG